MKQSSQTLMLLTTIFSILYFGLMKWVTLQPFDGMSVFIIVVASCLFLGWMIITYILATEITEQEDAK